VADVWRRGRLRYLICIALLIGASAISVVFVPVSKHRVSLSFILITLALSALVFLAVEALSKLAPERPGLLAWWGENALLLYVLHLVVLGLCVSPPIDWWYANAPLWLAALQLVAILAILSMIAWWMHLRRGRNHVELN
jgi:fucose 4-O-acetylase-like acetyltransferase